MPVAFSFSTLWFSASLSAIAGLLVAVISLAAITLLNRKARGNAQEFIQTIGFSKALKISITGAGTIKLESANGRLSLPPPQVANNSSNLIMSSTLIRNTDPIHPVDIRLISDGAPPAPHVQFLPLQG
jgi:hypothetical protein